MINIFLALISLFFVVDASAGVSVIISSPADKTFAATTQISLSATASASPGTITSVAYYVDSNPTPLAIVTTAPYTFNWNNVAPGTYALTAKATDSLGRTASSYTKTITVFSYVGQSKADLTNFTVPTVVSKTYGKMSQLVGDGTLNCTGGIVAYVKGFASADDGGQGWLYGDTTKASSPNDVTLINSPNCSFKRLHSNNLNIKLAGAKGDGLNDDTAAIQKVLNTKFNVIGNAATDTYLVKTSKVSTAGYKASLILYSGQKFNLNGSTIKLANGANSSVLMNDALYSSTNATLTGAAAPPTFPIDCADDGINDGIDDCVVIRNGTIDGNVANQKTTGLNGGNGYAFAPTVYLGNLKRSTLADVMVKNFYGAGIYFGGTNAKNVVTDITLNNIVIRDGIGTGVAVSGTRFKSNSIDVAGAKAFSENGVPVPVDQAPWGITPNSITLATNDSDFGAVRADNCGWGFKLQDGSVNNHFTKIWVTGTYGYGPSGPAQAVKFQGKSDGGSPAAIAYNDNTHVDEIISGNNQGNGLYVIYQKNLQITSYTGNNNGLGWTPGNTALLNYRDIEIIQSSLNITTANINSPTVGALDSRTPFPANDSTPNDRIFGAINISNPNTNVDNLFDIRAANNTVGKLFITASSPLAHYITYEYGAFSLGTDGDVNSYFGAKTIVSNQPMAAGAAPFQVADPGLIGHIYVHIDCIQLGINAPWLSANNTTTSAATAACPL